MVLASLTVLSVPGSFAAQSLAAGQDVLSDPVKPIIYWAGADGNDLKFVNSSTGDIIDSIVVGDGPTSICLSPDGATLYVAIPSYKCVVVVDANSHSITRNISLSFYPLSVRLDGKGFMYVSGSYENAGWVYSIDMRTWKVRNSVVVDWGKMVIETSPDGSTLLAMQMGSSPVKIYKYGINSGVFNYLDVDNHDLGSNLQGEKVDWARGRIYLASGGAYGVELVSTATLDRLGFWPMDAYPTCVALSSDGSFVFGAHDNWYERWLWVFNATDGSLMGKMYLNRSIEHLAIAHDLKNAYIGPPIQRIPLAPVIEHFYPAPGCLLGFSPTYFTVRFGRGMQDVDGQNATAAVDATTLALRPYDMDGYWVYFIADFNQTLSEGVHNFSVSLPWIGQVVWKNATFTIDRDSPQSLKPMLYPDEPLNCSIQLAIPLVIRARIVYTHSDWVVQGGWILLDGLNLSVVFNPQTLSAVYNDTPSLSWHNISACAYWDGGLGKAWANWSFLVMQGPLMTPLYPAKDQVLTQMPDHIEVALDLRDTGGNVSAPQLYLDSLPILTAITPNGTMRGDITSTIEGGTHRIKATLNWAAGKATLTWEFELDMFIGPTGEVLVRHEYKDEFSLLVPSGSNWILEEDSEISGQVFPLVMYGPTIGNFRTNVIVEHGSDRSVEESESYLQEQLDKAFEELEQSGIGVTMIGAPELRYVDNHTAYVATIQLEGYSVYQEFAIIASEDHEMVWVIILSTSISEFNSYSNMFDEMLESFKIEMKPASIWGNLDQAAIGIGIAALAGAASGAIVWLTRKRRGPVGPKQS